MSRKSRQRPKDPLGPDDPTEQHLIPRSRGGPTEEGNILHRFPHKLHDAWNTLFGNLKPLEVLSALLDNLLRPGEFRDYQKIVKKKDKPPKAMNPDTILLTIISRYFPKDWSPRDELMEELERRRKSPNGRS